MHPRETSFFWSQPKAHALRWRRNADQSVNQELLVPFGFRSLFTTINGYKRHTEPSINLLLQFPEILILKLLQFGRQAFVFNPKAKALYCFLAQVILDDYIQDDVVLNFEVLILISLLQWNLEITTRWSQQNHVISKKTRCWVQTPLCLGPESPPSQILTEEEFSASKSWFSDDWLDVLVNCDVLTRETSSIISWRTFRLILCLVLIGWTIFQLVLKMHEWHMFYRRLCRLLKVKFDAALRLPLQTL